MAALPASVSGLQITQSALGLLSVNLTIPLAVLSNSPGVDLEVDLEGVGL